jgi:hypothetical protein
VTFVRNGGNYIAFLGCRVDEFASLYPVKSMPHSINAKYETLFLVSVNTVLSVGIGEVAQTEMGTNSRRTPVINRSHYFARAIDIRRRHPDLLTCPHQA